VNHTFYKALNVNASLVTLLGELLTAVPAIEKVYDPKYKNPYLARMVAAPLVSR